MKYSRRSMESRDIKRQNRIKALRTTAVHAAPAVRSKAKSPLAFLRPYRGVFIALAIFLLGSTILNRMAVSDNGYVLTEHLNECALTVSSPYGESESLSMGDLARYIMRVERDGDVHARAYDEKDPTAYWKLRVSTAKEAAFISGMAKKTVMDYAVRDAIYAIEAKRAGLTLDEDTLKAIHYDNEREYFNMTGQEKSSTGLTIEGIEENMKKETLVHEYMVYLNDTVTDGTDVGSAYYEGLRQTYTINEDTEVTGPLRLGYVTIN